MGCMQAIKIKHHSTPDKVLQRNFNTDDDIFFDMDGLDTRDSNMPQIAQSDDDDGDGDEDFGMLTTECDSIFYGHRQFIVLILQMILM